MNMQTKFLLYLTLVLSGPLCGCSTVLNHPADLPVAYHNAKYHLTFWLPASWRGYSVLIQPWDASLYSTNENVVGTEQGPIITLRHPKWIASDPYQDIPIMVFTRRQWDEESQGRFFPYAGGIIYEMWHNDKYVFGNYSRYNWYELKGARETDDIINRNCAVHPEPHLYPQG